MKVLDAVEGFRDDMVKTLCDLIEIKAIAPEFGGDGEYKKAEYLMKLLDGFDVVERYDVEDERVSDGLRPNIVAKVKGVLEKTIWIVSHLDVVPEGDERLWETPPFKGVVKEGKIFGRGAEDNGQSIVSSLYAAKAIIESGLTPKYTLGLVFVADEEAGSNYGIKHVLKQKIFDKEDLFVIPDIGTPKGDMIEIAEKSILWLKFVVHGQQSHASMPSGLNASRRAMEFILDLDKKLHSKFNGKNELFVPPYSTFEPTKREKNVDNINTIPGLDVSYMDCRIIPDYHVEEVLDYIEDIRSFHQMKGNSKIEIEIVQKVSSPPTPENAQIIEKLRNTIEELRGFRPGVYGIGGNTCASFFRKSGFTETAAWCTADGVAHQANEYCVIDNMVEDAKVFSILPFEPGY
ncbi:MAG: M20 family metallo-hydrolase [Archaeoglobus sp.]|uniref:M20 family metallo-hydrolase n=1 Tax=Archaeoglobus sp. TaxID=1872626 RepID=UPI001D58236A|nr:M20 family metallo-hydrolase [Archaeoglobus sp.]MBO8179011.1 M20 family metallo-hydrolase [Archaeoglobus sp.]